MTASHQIKGLLAGLATVAAMGTAIAQSTPPASGAANPAMGAGQQSTQGTPMGATGVQPSTGGTAGSGTAGATAGTRGTAGTAGTTGTTGGTTMSGTTGGTAATTTTQRTERTTTTDTDRSTMGARAMRADRN